MSVIRQQHGKAILVKNGQHPLIITKAKGLNTHDDGKHNTHMARSYDASDFSFSPDICIKEEIDFDVPTYDATEQTPTCPEIFVDMVKEEDESLDTNLWSDEYSESEAYSEASIYPQNEVVPSTEPPPKPPLFPKNFQNTTDHSVNLPLNPVLFSQGIQHSKTLANLPAKPLSYAQNTENLIDNDPPPKPLLYPTIFNNIIDTGALAKPPPMPSPYQPNLQSFDDVPLTGPPPKPPLHPRSTSLNDSSSNPPSKPSFTPQKVINTADDSPLLPPKPPYPPLMEKRCQNTRLPDDGKEVKKRIWCSNCNEIFVDYDALLIHLQTHPEFSVGSSEESLDFNPDHFYGLYLCEPCGATFTRKRALVAHMRVHTGECTEKMMNTLKKRNDSLQQAKELRSISILHSVDEESFIKEYRLSKDLVEYVVYGLSSSNKLKTPRRGAISTENKFLTFLRVLSSAELQYKVGNVMSQPSVSRCVTEIASVFVEVFRSEIQFPRTSEERNKVAAGFHELGKFERVLGAIDCFHVPIRKPSKSDEFAHRKRAHSLNVQMVCDSQLRFVNVIEHSPGGDEDQQIWSRSEVCAEMRRVHQQRLGTFYLLGDADYLSEPCLMTPLPHNTRIPAERKYNEEHSKVHKTIHQALAVLKARFPILHKTKLLYNMETAMHLILSCAILHNMCIRRRLPPPSEGELSEAHQPKEPKATRESGSQEGLDARSALVRQYFS